MNIQQLDLTIPQRHLMEIFANANSTFSYGDECVRALLTYVQSLLVGTSYSSPTLDRMLAGTLPHINFEQCIHAALRSGSDCNSDEGGVPLSEISVEDYREILRNCYPMMITDLFPEPVSSIDPSKNLLVAWELGYGDKIREELWIIGNDEFRAILSLIYEYIMVCASGCPTFYQIFLAHWTHYLLTREWPDNEELYKRKWQEEKELREAYQKINAHLVKENQEYGDALKERFITIADAARAVLRVVYGQDRVEREADAWRKRIAESGVELGEAIAGRQGRKFYSASKVIKAFQETNREAVTDGQIADAVNARGVPKDKLPL